MRYFVFSLLLFFSNVMAMEEREKKLTVPNPYEFNKDVIKSLSSFTDEEQLGFFSQLADHLKVKTRNKPDDFSQKCREPYAKINFPELYEYLETFPLNNDFADLADLKEVALNFAFLDFQKSPCQYYPLLNSITLGDNKFRTFYHFRNLFVEWMTNFKKMATSDQTFALVIMGNFIGKDWSLSTKDSVKELMIILEDFKQYEVSNKAEELYEGFTYVISEKNPEEDSKKPTSNKGETVLTAAINLKILHKMYSIKEEHYKLGLILERRMPLFKKIPNLLTKLENYLEDLGYSEKVDTDKWRFVDSIQPPKREIPLSGHKSKLSFEQFLIKLEEMIKKKGIFGNLQKIFREGGDYSSDFGGAVSTPKDIADFFASKHGMPDKDFYRKQFEFFSSLFGEMAENEHILESVLRNSFTCATGKRVALQEHDKIIRLPDEESIAFSLPYILQSLKLSGMPKEILAIYYKAASLVKDKFLEDVMKGKVSSQQVHNQLWVENNWKKLCGKPAGFKDPYLYCADDRLRKMGIVEFHNKFIEIYDNQCEELLTKLVEEKRIQVSLQGLLELNSKNINYWNSFKREDYDVMTEIPFTKGGKKGTKTIRFAKYEKLFVSYLEEEEWTETAQAAKVEFAELSLRSVLKLPVDEFTLCKFKTNEEDKIEKILKSVNGGILQPIKLPKDNPNDRFLGLLNSLIEYHEKKYTLFLKASLSEQFYDLIGKIEKEE